MITLCPHDRQAAIEAANRDIAEPGEPTSRAPSNGRHCVLTEEIGGSAPGSGHELVIEAVDEQLPDELFEPPPRERWLRRRRR
jgi:hypothetical protein